MNEQQALVVARLPLAIRAIAPGEGFTRMDIPQNEGMHTGGPFLSPDGRAVWKPLDGRPHPDAQYHLPTREDSVLHLMEGIVGFPKNWRVEDANERRWLVRKVAYVVPETYERVMLTLDVVLQVEQAVRALNAKKWEVNDPLRVAIDPDTYDPFLLDLSSACPGKGLDAPLAYRANDALLFERWAQEVAGYDGLVAFRRCARKVVRSIEWFEGPYGRTHTWVYGSEHRPINAGLASIPDAVFVPSDWEKTGVHTWVITPNVLSDDLVAGYQLRWGYGPIVYEEAPS